MRSTEAEPGGCSPISGEAVPYDRGKFERRSRYFFRVWIDAWYKKRRPERGIMKNGLKRGIRPPLAAVLAAAFFLLSLTACRGSGELSATVSEAGTVLSALSGTASSKADSAPPGSASSAAVSALPSSQAPSSASSGRSPAGSKSPAPSGRSDVRAVKKIETPAAAQTKNLNITQIAVPQTGYQKIDQRSAYAALTAQGEKDLYGRIGKSVYQVSQAKNSMGYYPLQSVEVPSGLNEAQVCKTLVAFQDDNPQVFWVANAYSMGTLGNRTYLQLYSNLSLQQCDEYNRKFAELAAAAMRSVPSGLNEFGREESIFHYLTDRCTYDDAAAADPNLWQSYTAYGALVNGKAVCEGYSRAMQLLCGYAGLPCILLRGTGDGGNHMWNCVEVDDNWYHLDVTWCDNTALIYNYFNITDQVIAGTHKTAPAVSSLSDSQICNAAGFYNLVVPRCDSTLANYFLVRGIRVGTPGGLDDGAVVKAMAEQMNAGRKTLAFSVGPNGDFDSEVRELIRQMPVYLQASAKSSGKTLNLKSISYLTDSPDRGVNIVVPYAG